MYNAEICSTQYYLIKKAFIISHLKYLDVELKNTIANYDFFMISLFKVPIKYKKLKMPNSRNL